MPNISAEIISIGDELLIGQTINTNASWIGTQLTEIGVNVEKVSTISDKKKAIQGQVKKALKKSDIILITGGLGPTNDDITKLALSDMFGMKLKRDESVIKELEAFFANKGRTLSDVNRCQADLPKGCLKITNKIGTAPGMWFDIEGKVVVSMPGVPREMKAMITEFVLDKIKSDFKLPAIQHSIIQTVGIPESLLSEKLQDFEKQMPKNLSLAYLPSLGMVKLRLTARGENKAKVEKILKNHTEKIKAIADKYIFGYGETTLEAEVGKLLTEQKLTIATAESCTGGKLANTIVEIPGSSNYFSSSLVVYSYDAKEKLLGVDRKMLDTKGAVSEECAVQMAMGVRERLGTDIGVSSTGIAGPGGGTPEKPVGTVWIAFCDGKRTITKKLMLGENGRLANIELTTVACLNLIRKALTFEE